jgi:hypothetical protein
MSPRSKRECVEAVHRRYKNASRSERTIILNELCATCGYNRKYAIRLLRGFKRFTKPKPRKRGKPAVYQKDDILVPLRRIWLEANLPCSKRLQAILPLWLPGYGQYFGQLSEEVTNALLSISPATIDRLLKPVRIQYKKRGRSTTKPGTLLRNQIPILTNQWNEPRPGFLEADTVAHCGESLSGMFAYTIDTVDIATTWTEQRATWGKGETGVLKQIEDIERALPFPLLGFDSDNGSEFLNRTLFKHFTKRKHPVQFTRSRAYHKDDNAHVEQKNWTHVRQWLGYQRLDNPLTVPLLNDLYRREWRVFHNFFCPSVKLLDKHRVGSKTIKRYDSPKTPYQRVLESPYIAQETKNAMTKYLEPLNPFLLKKAIEEKLKRISSLYSSG